MLETEFQFFIENQASLVEKYLNKHVVIIGKEVVGAYSSFEEALINCQKLYTPGTYLIQLCTPGKESYTQTFHSRVIFH